MLRLHMVLDMAMLEGIVVAVEVTQEEVVVLAAVMEGTVVMVEAEVNVVEVTAAAVEAEEEVEDMVVVLKIEVFFC